MHISYMLNISYVYVCVYIYDIWGMHSEKHKYTHYIKHAYVCVHIHILMMVIAWWF